MSNSEMKPGRFLKLYNGRQKFGAIQNHLAAGGVVIIATYTKATQVSSKHSAMIKLGKSGSVYMQRGKAWDCIDHCALRFA